MNSPNQEFINLGKSLSKLTDYPIALPIKSGIIRSLKQAITNMHGSYKKIGGQARRRHKEMYGPMPTPPFEGYFFEGNNWDDFIEDIFVKIYPYSLASIEYVQNVATKHKSRSLVMEEIILSAEELSQ